MDRLFNRSFTSVIIVQIASLFGDAVLRFALPLYVLNLTGSAALMGVVAAAAWLPYIVLTPIGGVAADRVNKRRIMAALDILLALTCVTYLALEGVIDLYRPVNRCAYRAVCGAEHLPAYRAGGSALYRAAR